MRPANGQSGFTLIELMVVLVIVAVLVAVGVLSMKPNEQAILHAQERQIKSLLIHLHDQSALSGKRYLLAVDEAGLTVYHWQKKRWQIDPKTKPLMWSEALKVRWQVDNTMFAEQYQMPKTGWLFWPSGEVMSGQIVLALAKPNRRETARTAGEETVIRWNGLLAFEDEMNVP